MELICLLCHEEGTKDDGLIRLHEEIDHHGHLACLNTYYELYQSPDCPLCGTPLDGAAENLFTFNLSLEKASVLDRLDLFEKRLARLPLGNFRSKLYLPKLLKWVMPKLIDEYRRFIDYRNELRIAIMSTVKKNQVTFLQSLMNHLLKANVKFDLLSFYQDALYCNDKIYAKIILDTVLKNQAAFAENRLFEFLRAAIGCRELESASLILQKGTHRKFRKEVISNLSRLFHFVKPETDKLFYDCIGEWPLEELDYGLYLAARDGDLKCCNFLITKGARFKKAVVSGMLLKRCLDQDSHYLLKNNSMPPKLNPRSLERVNGQKE